MSESFPAMTLGAQRPSKAILVPSGDMENPSTVTVFPSVIRCSSLRSKIQFPEMGHPEFLSDRFEIAVMSLGAS